MDIKMLRMNERRGLSKPVCQNKVWVLTWCPNEAGLSLAEVRAVAWWLCGEV